MKRLIPALGLWGALGSGCGSQQTQQMQPPAYALALPVGFPQPRVPADNPLTAEKVTLGRYLFYDTRLSGNQTYSCGSCHKQALAFTDGGQHSTGSTGQATPRGSMSLANIAYSSVYTWANPAIKTLEQQALVPMYNQAPVELGLTGLDAEVVARLTAGPMYPALFAAAFPGEQGPISMGNVVKAIASFERTILSGRSPYDRYEAGDTGAISDSAKNGLKLFNSERCECYHCHDTFLFSDSVLSASSTVDPTTFHNTGLYNIDGQGGYPVPNRGLYETTSIPADMGKFRAPTLRNVALTAPYMHDGSIATLSDVLTTQYGHGGRLIAAGPYAGDGSKSPYKNNFLPGFTLSAQELQDMLNFLDSLTDDEFLHDPALSDPNAAASPGDGGSGGLVR